MAVLHEDPPVLLLEGFFTPEDCDAIRAAAQTHPALQASQARAGHMGSNTSPPTTAAASPAEPPERPGATPLRPIRRFARLV